MKLALVGEAWGEQEEKARVPFIGAAGQELTRMLEEAGIRRADCFITNVFNLHPEKNKIESLCVPKKEPHIESHPAIRPGKYPRAALTVELERLRRELLAERPNLVVALGGTATWAMLYDTRITKLRGSTTASSFLNGIKVLPTYHPAAILRQWHLRAVTILDLMKAARECEFPEVRRPERTVYVEPTLLDLEWFWNEHVLSASRIAFDIETKANQITCIGFATSRSIAINVPFVDPRTSSGSYWSSLEEELAAWSWVRRVLRCPIRKVAQNGLYDVHFLWRGYGICPVNFEDDSMLLHHSIHPESLKGLGFLGSVYTNEASWKLFNRPGTIKRDDE